MTLESWFSNLEQTPTRQVSLPALFKLLARYSRHVFKQRTEQNDLIIPISTDLQYLNLIAITLRLNWLSRSHELDASHSTDNNLQSTLVMITFVTVADTSVTTTNRSPFWDHCHPDDQTTRSYVSFVSSRKAAVLKRHKRRHSLLLKDPNDFS